MDVSTRSGADAIVRDIRDLELDSAPTGVLRNIAHAATGRRCGPATVIVSPSYFNVLDLPIVQGRTFSDDELAPRGGSGDRESLHRAHVLAERRPDRSNARHRADDRDYHFLERFTPRA